MIYRVIITLSITVLLSSCILSRIGQKENVPIYPKETVMRYNAGAIPVVIALHLHDRQLPVPSYNRDGSLSLQIFNDITFPVQAWIIYDAPNIHVFLARSPNSGCITQWHLENQQFYEPCLGTTFSHEGQYLSGPLSRNLDELTTTVQQNMIWVSNEIIYGEQTKQSSK